MSEVLEQSEPVPDPERDTRDPTPNTAERRPRRVAPAIAVVVAVVVGLFVAMAAVVKGGSKDTAETPLLGQPAPVVETTTIDGRPFDLASRRGSWVVLNFFSTWCRPCVEEHPDLVRFANGQASQPGGAELYSVIFNDDPTEVAQFFAERGGDWPKLVDPDGRIQVAFGVAKSPETWIIDPAGVVRARVISAVSAETLSGLLAQLQTGAPPGS
jgi:cytochrome c biogenesis protein CcmG/thiol:disulfide interchange protein DsbE